MGGQRHAPAALLSGMIRYPLCRRLGWSSGPVWTFCAVATDTVSINVAAPLHPVQYRTVYHFTFTEQKAPDNTEVRRSLQN
jgi:hypothetical protein